MSKRKKPFKAKAKKYPRIKTLSDEEFRRLIGVRKETFAVMVKVLKTEEKEKKKFGGKPNSLAIEDRLLMCLEYLREYRTYFHVGQSYGLTESACQKSCRWVEDVLIRSGQFSLPGRKALSKSDVEYEVVLIDASETPIERPKKK